MKNGIEVCLNCRSSKFEQENIPFTSDVRGKKVEVSLQCKICSVCLTPKMSSTQKNILKRKAADRYRTENSLLTSAEIIQYREQLKMSQVAFAAYLKVGEASIKRWETYYVQDCSQDNLMRLKCDKSSAQSNFFSLLDELNPQFHFTGNRAFSLKNFKNLGKTILTISPTARPFLSKLFFYCDFRHFKKYGIGITGNRYVPLISGPCPISFVGLNEPNDFESTPKPPLFQNQEKETIEEIIDFFQKKGGEELESKSRTEKAYLSALSHEYINYEHARDLLI